MAAADLVQIVNGNSQTACYVDPEQIVFLQNTAHGGTQIIFSDTSANVVVEGVTADAFFRQLEDA